jgi:malate synthase
MTDAKILSPDAVEFLSELHRKFNDRRIALLERRAVRQQEIDEGALPDFLPETSHIRESDWTVAPIPADLKDRRTEITGPTDRKMVINALNSGATMFMTDFEDANSPTESNMIEGQRNLMEAIRRTISFTGPEGKKYALNEKTAVLLVRPRGWHLVEKHFLVDGEPILLPAQTGIAPRSPALERCLRIRTAPAWHPERHHPRDGPD